MNKLGKRLRELRIEKHISQKALAAIIETNNSSVCDWECGRTEPSLDIVIKLCKYFEVSADYLLGLTDY